MGPSTVDETKIAQLLIEQRAAADDRNNGQTPLLQVVLQKKERMVPILLSARAEVNSRDHTGQTPLQWLTSFAENGNRPMSPEELSIANLLRRNGAT